MYKDIKMASNGWILTDPKTGEQEKITVDGVFPIINNTQQVAYGSYIQVEPLKDE